MRQAGPLHGRIPRAARALFAARYLPHARPRDRSHAAAGPPHRRRRGDPVLRSAAAARADRHPLRFHPRRRAGDRESAAQRSRSRRAPRASSRAKRSRYVLEAIRQIKRALGGRVPLIGFAGAPFTLASYAIEGGHSNNFAHTKALMYGTPGGVAPLLRHAGGRRRRLPGRADRSRGRRRAGVRLVGRRAERRATTASSSCRTRGGSSTRRARTADGVPTIHFGVGTGAILARAARSGRRRHRRRLAHAARRGVGAHRHRPRHSGQPRSDAAARAARPHLRGHRRRARARAADGPATSSTSVTASFRRRRSNTCRRSRGTCIKKRDADRVRGSGAEFRVARSSSGSR